MGSLVHAAMLWVALLLGTSSASAQELTAGGFRMASDPKIETVFGDTAQFKRYVDRFFGVHADMQRSREDFARNVQTVLSSLAAHRAAESGPRRCPADAIALGYTRAFNRAQTYHKLGKELESNWVSLRELDSLGETRGLTPDYRWKVARALKMYGQVLTDFREMKVSFQTQLAGELSFQGCDVQSLIAKGDELERSGAAPTAAPAEPVRPVVTKKRGKGQAIDAPPVAASVATFFVDNSSCKTALRVYLDGALLGEVGSAAKAAFRSLVGRHDLCLIPSPSKQQCGDTGTVRKTYIHDGWSILLRCE